MDELTNIVWRASDGSVLRSFAYGYNAASMITNISLETGTRIVYSYDDLDRLTAEIRTGEPGTFYEYDLAGNRMRTIVDGTTNTYSLGLGNRLATWTGGSYSHDAAGCVTNIVRSGRPELDLAWNGLYQVESVATNGSLAEAYGYGPLGRRLYTARNGVTNWHVYDGIHVVADVDDTGTVLRSYTWGAGIDNLLAFTDHTGGATNTYFALTDHLGTVHAFADESGSIVESYKYDAWGNVLGIYDGSGTPITHQQSTIKNRYLFQGREYSWATGLYFFRARWYDPETGRWLSKDPIGISGGLNQYVAFDNNPVMLRDPLGLCSEDGGYRTVRSPEILRWLVPGQIAWDNAQTAWINGQYGYAAGWTVNMLAEQVLVVLTLGQARGATQAASIPSLSSRSPTLGQTALQGVGDDMLVHLTQAGKRGSIVANGVRAQGGHTYFFRVGDVRHLTTAQAIGAVGQVAGGSAGAGIAVITSQNAASFTRVTQMLPEYMTSQNSVPWVVIRTISGAP
jgi:RHS repeat-associated protein